MLAERHYPIKRTAAYTREFHTTMLTAAVSSKLARHASRVDNGTDVVGDEAALITLETCALTKRLFKRRQWARPTREIDDGGPDHDWHVKPEPRRGEKSEEAAKNGKSHEAEMQCQHHFRADVS